MIRIKKAIQTCWACPSQWDAWDENDRYLYLRYRHGIGTVDTYDNEDWEEWGDIPSGKLARFEYGDSMAGEIELYEFMELAGMEWVECDPNFCEPTQEYTQAPLWEDDEWEDLLDRGDCGD